MPIRAITFDAAHTLFHPHPSVGAIYREVMVRHGLDFAEADLNAGFRRAFATVSKDKTELDGERREWLYWRNVVSKSIQDLQPQPSDFDTLFHDLWHEFARGRRWRVEPETPSLLQDLRRRGIRLALLTNWDRRVRQVVAESPLRDCFDHLFISSEIGHEKPDPGIFHFAQQALDLPPHQIAHVGDSLQHDIRGARAAGWHAIRILSESSPPTETSCPAAINLQQLPNRLPLLDSHPAS